MNWQQLNAILWLRWRLSRNQFIRAGRLSAVISLLILVFMGSAACALGICGLVGGVAAGRTVRPELLLIICDAAMGLFLVFWFVGVLAELQRAESLDIGKLLHLPISFGQVFLFNYAASHATPALILFTPLIGGFCVGLVFGGGVRMLLLAPVFISVLLAVTAWTYCLRGWLSALMANRRRARTIAVWLTMGFVLLAQIPNLIVHMPFMRSNARKSVQHTNHGQMPEGFVKAHLFIPPGWPGYAAMSLKQRHYLPALAGSAAAVLLAMAGLMRAYTTTRRYYTGVSDGASIRSTAKAATGQGNAAGASRKEVRDSFVGLQIPFLRDDIAGLALATLRSLMRAPELKMALLMPVVCMVAGFGSLMTQVKTRPDPVFLPLLLTLPLLIIPFLLAPTMSNVFGLDRSGFRALVLSPMPRKDILLARNLAFLPFEVVLCGLVLLAFIFVFHVGVFGLVTGVLQSAIAMVFFAHCANWLAILAPYRYSLNSLKAKKVKPITFLSALASMVVSPVVGIVVVSPVGLQFLWTRFGGPSWVPVSVIVAFVLLALAGWGYMVMLPVQGRLLQRREVLVLTEVTSELE